MPTLLTDALVRNAKVPAPAPDGRTAQVDLWDQGLPGFGLRLSSSGKKSWVVAVRLPGSKNPTRMALGSYPAMSLAEARQKARDAKVAATQHQDPREAEKKEKAARVEASRNTFAVLVDEFLEKYVARKGLRASTARDYRQILQGDDVAAWSKRPLANISKRDVLGVLDRIALRGSPVQANHFLVYSRRFFGWCVEREIILVAPTDRLALPSPVVARDRALSPDEIREVWLAAEALESSDEPQVRGDIFAGIFKLLLLTGQRREEVAGMRWEELRGLSTPAAIWEIPGDRAKNHKPHLVPLSSAVAAILNKMSRIVGSPFVFTTTGTSRVSGFGKAKFRLDVAITTQRLKEGITDPMPSFVIHDLRRTVSTRMHENLGIAPHIVEAALNHISGHRAGVAGTYNRALYIDEKRRALEAWARYVEGLVASRPVTASP